MTADQGVTASTRIDRRRWVLVIGAAFGCALAVLLVAHGVRSYIRRQTCPRLVELASTHFEMQFDRIAENRFSALLDELLASEEGMREIAYGVSSGDSVLEDAAVECFYAGALDDVRRCLGDEVVVQCLASAMDRDSWSAPNAAWCIDQFRVEAIPHLVRAADSGLDIERCVPYFDAPEDELVRAIRMASKSAGTGGQMFLISCIERVGPARFEETLSALCRSDDARVRRRAEELLGR